jgi:hypothetical protein
MEMKYIEFVEALARVADKALRNMKVNSINDEDYDLSPYSPNSPDMSTKMRKTGEM